MQPIVFEPPKSPQARASISYALLMGWVSISQSILFLLEVATRGITRSMSDKHIRLFAERLLHASHTRLEIFGTENINPNQSYVYMSNHESVMDIPVMLWAVPQSLRMVAKQVLFKVPFFGSAMARAGFIPIDRKNLAVAKTQLKQAKSRLEEGVSVWLAPEGTRSLSETLLPFKKGGFHVAVGLGVPIVPVRIKGAGNVMPPDSVRVNPNQIVRVFFGKPIETKQLQIGDLTFLMQNVREAIERMR